MFWFLYFLKQSILGNQFEFDHFQVTRPVPIVNRKADTWAKLTSHCKKNASSHLWFFASYFCKVCEGRFFIFLYRWNRPLTISWKGFLSATVLCECPWKAWLNPQFRSLARSTIKPLLNLGLSSVSGCFRLCRDAVRFFDCFICSEFGIGCNARQETAVSAGWSRHLVSCILHVLSLLGVETDSELVFRFSLPV